jgi:UDPglucose 6-dehydrogenase
MRIAIAGTGYVGLVTGVCLAEVGHQVTCFDINEEKIEFLRSGTSPIYEPGLEELMKKNMEEGRLFFTSSPDEAYRQAEVVFIAVGTPEKEDGSADLRYIEKAAITIAQHVNNDVVVVIKSTVPVGTNEKVEQLLKTKAPTDITIRVVSNPEFLREGSAVYDTFHADRIVIGANDEEAGNLVEKIYEPFHLPILRTDIRSAEMIKYASNVFLATKISFINEIANLCEKTGADIEDVAKGMGMDQRIGAKFLRAGIGFGGSCFPKDTKALQKTAAEHNYQFHILDAVLQVNNIQKGKLYEKAKTIFPSLQGKTVAVLGLAFKPNTDDIREAPSLELLQQLLLDEANVRVYDPIAMKNVKKIFGDKLTYASHIEEAITEAEVAFIVTEWDQIKQFPLTQYQKLMKHPLIIDGRNCYTLDQAQQARIHYLSIGRKPIIGDSPALL